MTLFYDFVCKSEKDAMIAVLKRRLMKLDFRKLNTQSIEQFQNKTLLNFVTKRSINLSTAFKIYKTFLNDDPTTWPSALLMLVPNRR